MFWFPDQSFVTDYTLSGQYTLHPAVPEMTINTTARTHGMAVLA